MIYYVYLLLQSHVINFASALLGDPEVTANLYCNFVSVLGRLRDLQYVFSVTSGSPSSLGQRVGWKSKFSRGNVQNLLQTPNPPAGNLCFAE